MADITELFGLQAPTGTTESSNQADSKDVHPEGEEDKGFLLSFGSIAWKIQGSPCGVSGWLQHRYKTY